MRTSSSNLRGIILMVLATAAFTTNDTLLKLAMSDLPPFQALFIRGIFSSLWAIPLLAIAGKLRALPLVFDRKVQLRNLFELVAVLGFILALAYAPIADITAISQLAPMIVLIGAAMFFGEKIGRLQIGLIAVAFAGALLVAQPGGSGFSVFALFGFWNAIASATRDLLGRRIAREVPGLIVATGAALIVLVGAGVASFLFEEWVTPDTTELLLIAGSGLFLMFGHFLLFTAFRTASTASVVPFLYMATIWALIAGVLVFDTVPNGLAFVGMGLILVSGVVVVAAERWWRRPLTLTA